MTGSVAGLWGKMPAHGDFVRRGWGDDVTNALDAWASPTLARWRTTLGEEAFADAMRTAPLWHGVLPADVAGPEALRVVLTPSVDRVGRLFLLALGVVGAAAQTAPPSADVLESIAYAAVAGELDADGVVAAIAAAPAGPALSGGGWWADRLGLGAPTIPAGQLDPELLDRMLTPDAAAAVPA